MDLKQLYEAACAVEPNQALRQVITADSDEERRFFAFVANMNLQRRQQDVIEQHLF